MSDHPFDGVRLRRTISGHLSRIWDLFLDLHWQAEASFADRTFPGGDALNLMASAAIPQDWQARYDEAEEASENPTADTALHALADDQSGDEHPLYVIGYWTRIIREERHQPTTDDTNLAGEISYMRANLDWMIRIDPFGDPEWFEVTEVERDLRALVHRMENLLIVGTRLDTSATACLADLASTGQRCGGRLVRVTLRRRKCEHVKAAEAKADKDKGIDPTTALRTLFKRHPKMWVDHRDCDQGGRDDIYRCQSCDKRYSEVEYWLAVRENYERQAG